MPHTEHLGRGLRVAGVAGSRALRARSGWGCCTIQAMWAHLPARLESAEPDMFLWHQESARSAGRYLLCC